MEQYDDVWKSDIVDMHFKAEIPQKMLELFEQEHLTFSTAKAGRFV